MSNAPDRLEHKHVDDRQTNTREARIFRFCAGALCVTWLTFGLLNLWDII
jgi:hypothetical protein